MDKTPIFRRTKEGVRALLDYLVQEKGLTLSGIGRRIGKDPSEITRYKKGVKLPNGETFEKMRALASAPPPTALPEVTPQQILGLFLDLKNTVDEIKGKMETMQSQLDSASLKKKEPSTGKG